MPVCSCLYVFVCMCLSVCLSVCLSACVCVYLCVCSMCMCVYVCALCVDQIGGRCSWATSSVLCAQCQVPCSMRLSDHLCVFSVMSLRRCDAPMWSMLCSPNTHLIYWFILIFILSAQSLTQGSLWTALCDQPTRNVRTWIIFSFSVELAFK